MLACLLCCFVPLRFETVSKAPHQFLFWEGLVSPDAVTVGPLHMLLLGATGLI